MKPLRSVHNFKRKNLLKVTRHNTKADLKAIAPLIVLSVLFMAFIFIASACSKVKPAQAVQPLLEAPGRDSSYDFNPADLDVVFGPGEPIQPVLKATVKTVNNVENKVKSTASMTSVELKIREIATEVQFQWPDYLVKLARCESTLNPKALGDGSYRSRGIFQISAHYHPTVTDECAYDVACATRWTIKKIEAGQQHLWSCDRIIN